MRDNREVAYQMRIMGSSLKRAVEALDKLLMITAGELDPFLTMAKKEQVEEQQAAVEEAVSITVVEAKRLEVAEEFGEYDFTKGAKLAVVKRRVKAARYMLAHPKYTNQAIQAYASTPIAVVRAELEAKGRICVTKRSLGRRIEVTQ